MVGSPGRLSWPIKKPTDANQMPNRLSKLANSYKSFIRQSLRTSKNITGEFPEMPKRRQRKPDRFTLPQSVKSNSLRMMLKDAIYGRFLTFHGVNNRLGCVGPLDPGGLSGIST